MRSSEFPEPVGETPPDLSYWVALASIPGMGSASLWRLIRRFGDLSLAWAAARQALVSAGLDTAVADGIIRSRDSTDPGEQIEALEGLGARAIAWHDPVYPPQLREIPDPPALLYVRGDIRVADFSRAVAIVGTRRMSSYGRQAAERLAEGLAQAGVCVVSGMAAGIDSAAHRGALDAGGRTVAVWGTGLQEVYPASNRSLAQRIHTSGAVVTEYPLGMRGIPENFPQRNRIISGLSRGTVVVEAPRESGALITARYALEQNREIMAVPGDVFADTSRGTNALLFRGEARAVTSARDVLETLAIDAPAVQLELAPGAQPVGDERSVYAHLNATPQHIDELARATELAAQRVSAILSIMEIRGLARHTGGGRYVAAHAPMGTEAESP